MEFDDPVSGCVQIGRVSAFGGTGAGRERATVDDADDTKCRPDADGGVSQTEPPRASVNHRESAVEDERLSAGQAIPGSPPTFTQVTQLTFGGTQDRESPEVDPTGLLVCYTMDTETGSNCYSQIWCVPANGGPEEQLSFEPGDHYDPVWASPTEIVYTYSPDKGYDMTYLLDIATGQEKPLSTIQTDHDNADVVAFDSLVVQEALDDAGNSQLTRVYLTGGLEAWLTSGQADIMEPDYCQDERSVFAVRWTGITSQIVCVDALQGGYYTVTDTCAIRDNPDGFARGPGTTSYVVYEREAWEPLDLLLGGKRRPGTGIYASRFRRPHDGEQGASLFLFALDRVRPNPATDKVVVHWQVPAEADVSLKVYNTAGQLVKVLASGKTKPGAHTTVWNGTDAKGRRLANGVYFCALDNGAKRISRKLVLTE
jgi:hypothetical protein